MRSESAPFVSFCAKGTQMRDPNRDPSDASNDPIETLLRHLLTRSLSRSIAGSAAVAAALGGCSTAREVVPIQDGSPATLGGDAGMSSGGQIDGATGGDTAADAGAVDGSARGDASSQPSAVGEPVACPEGAWFPVRAQGLAPAETFDYVAVRSAQGFHQAEGDGSWTSKDFSVLSETGSACATQTSDACATQVAHHPNTLAAPQCMQICEERSIVTTRGDDVRRWATPEELRTLLGTIDSQDDALMLVYAAGYDVRCNDAAYTAVRELDDGYEVYATRMTEVCAPIIVMRYKLHVSRAGQVTKLAEEELSRQEGACVGRRPSGLVKPEPTGAASPLGAFLASSAHLEAASVYAFERLATELEAHGAPSGLVAKALAARDDEVVHAALVTRLAEARGGVVPEVQLAEAGVRSLEAMALENAVEGCVRETFGAFVGAHQALWAEDLELRLAMRTIADDETRHAALSHHVHAFLMGKLDAPARARVCKAMADAVNLLAAEYAHEPETTLRAQAGLPDSARALALLAELERELWMPTLARAA
jgi:hypothetical protein